MSITDELRDWAHGFTEPYKRNEQQLLAIADRIDAEHERECKEQYACGAEHGIGASIDASMIQTHGYVELPKDADGEYIHVGDVLTDDAEFNSEGKVARLMLEDEDWFVGFGCGGWTEPSIHEWHHYHAPTVEDVLREFGIDWEYESDCEDRAALLKEYAAKLKLADGEDA